jgi:hypothetical protein
MFCNVSLVGKKRKGPLGLRETRKEPKRQIKQKKRTRMRTMMTVTLTLRSTSLAMTTMKKKKKKKTLMRRNMIWSAKMKINLKLRMSLKSLEVFSSLVFTLGNKS